MLLQKCKKDLQLNGITQLLTYVNDIALQYCLILFCNLPVFFFFVGDNKETLINNVTTILNKMKKIGLHINVEKTKHMFTDKIQNIQNKGNFVIRDKIFERTNNFKINSNSNE